MRKDCSQNLNSKHFQLPCEGGQGGRDGSRGGKGSGRYNNDRGNNFQGGYCQQQQQQH